MQYSDVPEAAEDLVEAYRLLLLGQLMPSLVHDINNAIASVSGIAQLLMLTITDPTVRDRVQSLDGLAQRLARATEAIARVGEFSTGSAAPIAVSELFNQVQDIVSTAARHAGVTVSQVCEDADVVLRGNIPLLRRLLLGLTLAALEWLERAHGGEVALRSRAVEGRFEISVEGKAADAESSSGPQFHSWVADLRMKACAEIARIHGGNLQTETRPTGAYCAIVTLPTSERA